MQNAAFCISPFSYSPRRTRPLPKRLTSVRRGGRQRGKVRTFFKNTAEIELILVAHRPGNLSDGTPCLKHQLAGMVQT